VTYLRIDPTTFASDAAAGFVAAHGSLVRSVPGGVVRATATQPGQVAVVIGGGSGHYPAFAGLVGPGLAHGAALGEVFASPSAQRVFTVARTVATDAGVLLCYGNYAGDVLNFDDAQRRLIADGIPCRTVRVTDDVSSAPPTERERRRGIAGGLAVFRAAAWAAEQGYSLEEVARFAAYANASTRTIGVAFSGCALPGASAPLFSVPVGRMAVGMGIHGEPGIDEVSVPSAREIAEFFVTRLLAERPEHPSATNERTAVILNGLGSVKSEELFVVYTAVARCLEQAGLTVVEPEVGEFATSFDMAGISLTLVWLNAELEQAWVSPACAPAYRKGVPTLVHEGDQSPTPYTAQPRVPALVREAEAHLPELPVSCGERPGLREDGNVPRSRPVSAVSAVGSAVPLSAGFVSPASVLAGRTAAAALEAIRASIDENVDELGRLDHIAGDGDHGIGMQRGAASAAAAAQAAADADCGVKIVLCRAGEAWADAAGGASGALWGRGLQAMGEHLGTQHSPTPSDVVAAILAARDAVHTMGRAVVGDKTLVDALVPFTDTLAVQVANGASLVDAWHVATQAATAAAVGTADLSPRVGRACLHTTKSLGTPDPGAISLSLAFAAVSRVLVSAEHRRSGSENLPSTQTR